MLFLLVTRFILAGPKDPVYRHLASWLPWRAGGHAWHPLRSQLRISRNTRLWDPPPDGQLREAGTGAGMPGMQTSNPDRHLLIYANFCLLIFYGFGHPLGIPMSYKRKQISFVKHANPKLWPSSLDAHFYRSVFSQLMLLPLCASFVHPLYILCANFVHTHDFSAHLLERSKWSESG